MALARHGANTELAKDLGGVGDTDRLVEVIYVRMAGQQRDDVVRLEHGEKSCHAIGIPICSRRR